jgi:hypothetical protein
LLPCRYRSCQIIPLWVMRRAKPPIGHSNHPRLVLLHESLHFQFGQSSHCIQSPLCLMKRSYATSYAERTERQRTVENANY